MCPSDCCSSCCCFSTSLTCLVICCLISIPCIIMSCNEWSCPLQYDILATSLHCEFFQRACTCCFQNNIDGECFKWGTCDCSYYVTNFEHSIGTCTLQTPRSYPNGEIVRMFVNKYSHECIFPTITFDHIAYVGVIFIILAILFAISAIISLVMFCLHPYY